MRVGIALIAMCGCGRLSFDAVSDANVDRDTAPCIAAIGCQAFETAGSCYQLCPVIVDYAFATAACADWGGCLVALDEPGETDAVRAMLTVDTWTGLFQATGAAEPAGGWAWPCSTAAVPIPWDALQPDNQAPPEQCAMVHTNGTMFDCPCDWDTAYVCER